MATRSCTPLTFELITMASWARPSSSARAAEASAETTVASRSTSSASIGSGQREFSSIIRVSRSWSRLPQLTPMRTGLRCRQAVSIIAANCGSRLLPRPTLPGLMRYLSSASAQAGCAASSLCPLKWKSPTSGTSQSAARSRSRTCGTAAAASSVLTVTRTSSEPASASSRTWRAVASTSAVSVFVIDCTTTGAPPPTVTAPMRTATVRRFGHARDYTLCPGAFTAQNPPVAMRSCRRVRARAAPKAQPARKRSGTRTAGTGDLWRAAREGPPKGSGTGLSRYPISQVSGQRGGGPQGPPPFFYAGTGSENAHGTTDTAL